MTRLIAIFLLAVLLAGCSQPSAATAPANSAGDHQQPPLRGFVMNFTHLRDADLAIREIDTVAAHGCNAINFVFYARQENTRSTTLAIPWNEFPSSPDIKKIVLHAKSKGMTTLLMPSLYLDRWRGEIQPDDWDAWFHNYTTYIKNMATLAKQTGIDILAIGSELSTTEAMLPRWQSVIDEVRKIYKGKLTYAANWDHYTVPAFWNQLDYIGVSEYIALADRPGLPIPALLKTWAPFKQNLLAFAKANNKPMLFIEIGFHNTQSTLKEPWDYASKSRLDLPEQQRGFQSFIEAWQDLPAEQFAGAFIWEWVPNIDAATAHPTYSLQNTPALAVVSDWMKSAPTTQP